MRISERPLGGKKKKHPQEHQEAAIEAPRPTIDFRTASQDTRKTCQRGLQPTTKRGGGFGEVSVHKHMHIHMHLDAICKHVYVLRNREMDCRYDVSIEQSSNIC